MHQYLRSLALLMPLFLSAPVAAEQYPERTVVVIVPFTAGQPTDIAARTTFAKVGEILHTSFVIENKPGALGTIGLCFVAHANPDGYTIAYSPDGPLGSVLASYAVKGEKPQCDLDDFTPIALTGENQFVLVIRDTLPVRSVSELVAYGKEHPGKLLFASQSPSGKLCVALLNKYGAGIMEVPNFTHPETQGHAEIIGEIMDGMCSTIFTARPYIADGKERALGVQGPTRSRVLPDIPTLQEQGFPEFGKLVTWHGVLAPKGLAPEIVTRLNSAILQALADEEVRKQFESISVAPRTSTPEEFGLFMREQLAIVTSLFKAGHITIN